MLGPDVVPEMLGGTVCLLAGSAPEIFCRYIFQGIFQATLSLTSAQIFYSSLLSHLQDIGMCIPDGLMHVKDNRIHSRSWLCWLALLLLHQKMREVDHHLFPLVEG